MALLMRRWATKIMVSSLWEYGIMISNINGEEK
jgi:hypothetical protein